MPVYQAGATLEVALRSLQRQRETRWECVAVDDGSSDAGPAILAELARSDARLRVLRSAHGGIAAALQRGLEHCRAPLVARMDADDIALRDRLWQQQAALAEQPQLAGVGCHVRSFPRSSLGPGRLRYEAWLNSLRSARDVARDAFVECPLAHPTWMIRREVLVQAGYRRCPWPEDYDIFLRLHLAGHQLAVVPRRLLAWRDSPGRLSRRDTTYAIERFTRCRAHYLARSLLRRGDRYVLWGYGATGRTLCRALLEEGKRPSAIVELHPGRIGQKILGAPVLRPSQLPSWLSAQAQPVVACVARQGPRSEVREALARLGLLDGRDFVCAA